MKNRLFFLMVCTCIAAAFVLTAGCASSDDTGVNPADIVFHYGWEGNIDKSDLTEPSGIVYHPGRDALYAVGDEGDIARMKTDGTEHEVRLLRPKADLEGITVNPATGLLYAVIEGKEKILEVYPDSMKVKREFQVERTFEGKTVFEPGGNGTEGVTFRPDESHPEGGTFYMTNQSFSAGEASFIAEVEVPLKSGGDTAQIRRLIHPGVSDLAALYLGPHTESLLVVSDGTNSIYRIDDGGRVISGRAFVGNDQEGLTLGPEGYMYIAQDCGGIIKVWPKTLLGPQEEYDG